MADRLLGVLLLLPFVAFAFLAFRGSRQVKPSGRRDEDFQGDYSRGALSGDGHDGGAGHP